MKYLRREAGNTLIETLVTVAIVGVIIASGMPKFDPRRQDINTALATLLGDFRYTRARAITAGTHFSIKMNSSTQYQVQRHVQAADGTWANASAVQTVNLPDTLTLSMFPTTIEFNTRGLMVTETSPGVLSEIYVYLNDNVGSRSHRFSVWPSGQVNEDF